MTLFPVPCLHVCARLTGANRNIRHHPSSVIAAAGGGTNLIRSQADADAELKSNENEMRPELHWDWPSLLEGTGLGQHPIQDGLDGRPDGPSGTLGLHRLAIDLAKVSVGLNRIGLNTARAVARPASGSLARYAPSRCPTSWIAPSTTPSNAWRHPSRRRASGPWPYRRSERVLRQGRRATRVEEARERASSSAKNRGHRHV